MHNFHEYYEELSLHGGCPAAGAGEEATPAVAPKSVILFFPMISL